MAQRFWPNDDPLGKRFTEGRPSDHAQLLVVIGVVGNSKIDALDEKDAPQFYVPFFQAPNSYLTFAIRTTIDPLALAGAIKNELSKIDENESPYDIVSMQEVMLESLSTRQLLMLLLVAFAVLAIVLAAVGIYGVTFYLTSRRTQEIGIRMALGADRPAVLRLVLFRGLVLTTVGLVVGVIASLFLTRFLAAFLYGVQPADPGTLAITSVLVFVVAFVAAAIPAYRVTRIDPMVALRYE
ncbi:MAG: FtsX-like permease family protein [Bryobacteraceae bacterium]